MEGEHKGWEALIHGSVPCCTRTVSFIQYTSTRTLYSPLLLSRSLSLSPLLEHLTPTYRSAVITILGGGGEICWEGKSNKEGAKSLSR